MHNASKFLILLAVFAVQRSRANEQPSFATTVAVPVSFEESAVWGPLLPAASPEVTAPADPPPGATTHRVRLYAEATDSDLLEGSLGDPAEDSGVLSRRTVFKVHPLATLGGLLFSTLLLPLELESALAPNVSLYLMGSPVLSPSALGIALNGGGRFYLSSNAPRGFWIGGQLGSVLVTSRLGMGASFDFQLQLGYQWVLGNGLTMGIFAGLSVPAAVSGRGGFVWGAPIGFAW